MQVKQQLKSLITGAIIVSIILGGIAGGVVGFITSSFFTRRSRVVEERKTGIDVKQDVVDVTVQENSLEGQKTVSVVENALPAVVSIIATQELQTLPRSSFFDNWFFYSPFEQFNNGMPRFERREQQEPKIEKRQTGSGSGFIVTEDGLIVTNRHVVANMQAEYSIVLSSGKTYDAEVVDRDSIQDLAVLKIKLDKEDQETKFSALELGSSEDITIGQTVIAIGNTLGEFRNTVTRGIISGINRTLTAGGINIGSEVIEGAIQTDAAISSGNSGGPLLNLEGKVIGVNTAVSQAGENIGFALPVDQVTLILDSIKEHGKIKRPFLGVRYILLNQVIAEKNNMDLSYGALIVRGDTREDLAVIPGSPADKAGIKENDVILEVEGVKVEHSQSLPRLLAKYQVGDTVVLKIYRAEEEIEVSVVLEDRDDG